MEPSEFRLILKSHLQPKGIIPPGNEVNCSPQETFNSSLIALTQWVDGITLYISDGSESTIPLGETIEIVRAIIGLELDLLYMGWTL